MSAARAVGIQSPKLHGIPKCWIKNPAWENAPYEIHFFVMPDGVLPVVRNRKTMTVKRLRDEIKDLFDVPVRFRNESFPLRLGQDKKIVHVLAPYV